MAGAHVHGIGVAGLRLLCPEFGICGAERHAEEGLGEAWLQPSEHEDWQVEDGKAFRKALGGPDEHDSSDIMGGSQLEHEMTAPRVSNNLSSTWFALAFSHLEWLFNAFHRRFMLRGAT